MPVENLPSLLLKLWRHFSLRRQRQFVWLLGLMLLSAFAEVVSLGAVMPFLSTLIAPELVFKSQIVARFAKNLNFTSADQLVLPLTMAFIVAALIAGATRILMLYANTSHAFSCVADISIEVYRRTLYQPYWVHVTRNSSEVISGITNKVGSAVNVLSQLLTLISSLVLLVVITLALLMIDPFVALVSAGCFSASYVLITFVARRQLQRSSQRIAHEQTQVVKALQEGLGGIRDVLLDGTQETYCKIYRQADHPLRLAQGKVIFIAQCPRFAMEALGMTLIAVLAYSLCCHGGGLGTALPVLGALALGAQRLLPALQQGYGAWTTIAGARASLSDTLKLLDQPLPADDLQPPPPPLSFQDNIRFDNVRFRYTSDSPWVLNGFNLTIAKGARIGVVGSTGSGKSTTLDLLMGLLTPTDGEILVDGKPLTGTRLRAWQRTIAHVPQGIYLADTTLQENIAFGEPAASIDFERVRHAARQAQIAEYIESRPEGYNAFVGERGIRLSGGQRQRIGIARALYKEAGVLVFDEATSALDNATEQSVMDAIDGLNSDLTILIIAHRLSTVRRCDLIIELENGRVVAQGTFEELLYRSPSFRTMASATV